MGRNIIHAINVWFRRVKVDIARSISTRMELDFGKAKIDLNFALSQVHEIVFYKRDEITTDLICCEISISSDPPGQVLFFHEEMPNWQELIDRVSELPNFDMKWFEKVVQPPFQEQRTIAYRRKD